MTPKIHTQDNRADWRLRQNACLLERWTPPLRWRIARWWRRLTGQRRSV